MLRERRWDAFALALALCAGPISIAVTESLLGIALVARIVALSRGRARVSLPRVFWFWLLWALMEVASWLCSPDIAAGWGEIRHLAIVAALFLLLPALDRTSAFAVWQGLFATATVSSASVVTGFVARSITYRREILASPDPTYYARSGGLLHHWMIYGTMEILIIGALLEYWFSYPERRRWLLPALVIHAVAVVLSLTRMLWICALLMAVFELVSHRSKWIWALPLVPGLLFFTVPQSVRTRIIESMKPGYYSNAERIQMLRVGWKMIEEKPLAGVGAGRVEKLYRSYLTAGEPVPAYYGHLHNNYVQLASQFGLPVLAAAALCLAILATDLARIERGAFDRERRFLSRAALLGVSGFVLAGMVEYTCGHSLSLILVMFVALAPLVSNSVAARDLAGERFAVQQ